jgi:murein DD-endopeptidase MepM/ murein hydrolase activator NlpD
MKYTLWTGRLRNPTRIPVFLAATTMLSVGAFCSTGHPVTMKPSPALEQQVLPQSRVNSGFNSGVNWLPPLHGVHGAPILLRPFDPPVTQFASGHRGIDFLAPTGTPVYAIGQGVVAFAGLIAGKPVISISHGIHPRISASEIRTTYEPVKSSLTIGEKVGAGQLIGKTSPGTQSSHCADICLHVGLKYGVSNYMNPEMLWRRTSVLLPIKDQGSENVQSKRFMSPQNPRLHVGGQVQKFFADAPH